MNNTKQDIIDRQEVSFSIGWRGMSARVWETHQAKGWTAASVPTSHVWQGNQLMLMVTELAEAHEALRKDLNDDKITTRKGVEVELADVIILIMNFATETGLDIAGALAEKAEFNDGREHMHGGKKF